MPYKDKNAHRIASKLAMRRHRAKQKAKAPPVIPAVPADPIQSLADWSRDNLIVPPGHDRAGEPMELPPFAIDFLRQSYEAHESALCVARKNGKSAICAILVLGYLCGTLRQDGWRGAVCSVSKDKANELRKQVAAIAEASQLEGITIRRSPYPGLIESDTGQFEVLSADRSAGHASGFDLVLIDETGLLHERDRELLAGLRSSVSAKNGRIVHISIRGDSPLFREVLDNPETVKKVYAADEGCELDDRDAWQAANPGLNVIKSADYMAAEVKRVRNVPADEPSFRAYDLNLAVDPTREMIFAPSELTACFTDQADRQGGCVLGFDFGEAASATAAVAIWPQTGWVECFMGFGDVPNLQDRGRIDDSNYALMAERGELWTYPGRVTPVAQFLSDVAKRLTGSEIQAAAADGFKSSEVQDWLDRQNLNWPIEFRRVGAGRDGGRDIRATERLVLERKLKMAESLALSTAISKSQIHRDANGNPGLNRAHRRGRIDLLSAFVIACGLAESLIDQPVHKPRMRILVA